jgi:competence protein ComEA
MANVDCSEASTRGRTEAKDGLGLPPARESGGRISTPALLRRLLESQWALVLFKGLTAFLLLVALAAVGLVSSYRGSTLTLQRSVGNRVWLPEAHAAERRRGEPSRDAGADAPPSAVTADGRIVLNLAGADELRRLPGVGARRAEAILALRAKLRRFRRVSDLLRVRGIGVRSLKKIAPLVVLDPPPEPPTDAGSG